MVGYLFALAYVAAGITYWTALAAGLLERLPCTF
jgi:ferrous iron transport protein B